MSFLSTPLTLTLFFAMFVFSLWLSSAWKSPALKDLHQVYDSLQKIHEGHIPRLGGLILYVFLVTIVWTNNFSGSELLRPVLLALLPTVGVTLIEDLFNNIQPKARLVSIVLSSMLLVFATDVSLPRIDIPGVMDFFIAYPFLLSMLLVLSLSGLANGFNMIDGANGLLYMSFISILCSMIFLAHALDSLMYVNINSVILILVCISLVFNYPYGQIFAGDLGAYCLGLLIGFLSISFFAEHPELITWYALLILFYPTFEILFSMYRRFRLRKSLMQADASHLHQLLFRLLCQRFSHKVANNLIVIILSPIWIFPLVWLMFFGASMNFFMTWLGILIEVILYLMFYYGVQKILHEAK